MNCTAAFSTASASVDVNVSQRDYFKAHRSGYHGTYIGEVIDTKPFGGIGFTISRRDPATDIVAVADDDAAGTIRPSA